MGSGLVGMRRDIAGVADNVILKAQNENEQSRKSYNSLEKQARTLKGVEFFSGRGL